ncbi:hypothetical protein M3J09_005719 [Ascochyta lentis]
MQGRAVVVCKPVPVSYTLKLFKQDRPCLVSIALKINQQNDGRCRVCVENSDFLVIFGCDGDVALVENVSEWIEVQTLKCSILCNRPPRVTD